MSTSIQENHHAAARQSTSTTAPARIPPILKLNCVASLDLEVAAVGAALEVVAIAEDSAALEVVGVV
jgi:hypothetical protein